MGYADYRKSVPAKDRRKFDFIVNEMKASGKLSGMSQGAQDKIFSNIAQRYGGEAPVAKPVSNRMLQGAGSEGGGASDFGTGPTSGVLGGPDADSMIGGHLRDAAGSFGKKAAMKGALGLAQGGTLGQVLGGIANPVAIAGAVASAIGKGTLESMGFETKAANALESIGIGAVSAALSMVNPALGIAAGVLAKPAAELAADWMDVRTAEEDRDAIEDAYGKVKGMQLNKSLMNDINLEQYRPENMSKKDFGYNEAIDAVGARYDAERARAMKDPNRDLSELDQMQGDLQTAREGAAAARGEWSKEARDVSTSMANRERSGTIAQVERDRGNLRGGGMLSGGGEYSGDQYGGRAPESPGDAGGWGDSMANREDSGSYGGSSGGEGGFGGGSSSGGDFGDRESERGGMGGV